jgi:Apea-like HEPN
METQPFEHSEIFGVLECITPLYGFNSDAERLTIGRKWYIQTYEPDVLPAFKEHDQVAAFLRVFPPDYTLHQQMPITPDLKRLLDEGQPRPSGLMAIQHISILLSLKCLDTIRTLRLFKSEKLRCGPTWVFRFEMPKKEDAEKPGECKLEAHFSVAGTLIDSLTRREDFDKYTLNVSELPSLRSFQDSLGNLSEKLAENPAIALAVDRHGSSNEIKSADEIIDLFICLESLMLEQEEGLSIRLAQRTANLLGDNAKSRLTIYKQLREFYGLRSKIVHGSNLSNKQRERLKNIQPLREIARRAVLAVLGVSVEIPLGPLLYGALDKMSLDDEKRKHLQRLAATHLVVPCGTVTQ